MKECLVWLEEGGRPREETVFEKSEVPDLWEWSQPAEKESSCSGSEFSDMEMKQLSSEL